MELGPIVRKGGLGVLYQGLVGRAGLLEGDVGWRDLLIKVCELRVALTVIGRLRLEMLNHFLLPLLEVAQS